MRFSLAVVLVVFLLWFIPQRIYDVVDASKAFLDAFRPTFIQSEDPAASSSSSKG